MNKGTQNTLKTPKNPQKPQNTPKTPILDPPQNTPILGGLGGGRLSCYNMLQHVTTLYILGGRLYTPSNYLYRLQKTFIDPKKLFMTRYDVTTPKTP